jgi:hypothetical protein
MNIGETGLHIRKTSEEPSLISPSEPLFSLQKKSTTHPLLYTPVHLCVPLRTPAVKKNNPTAAVRNNFYRRGSQRYAGYEYLEDRSSHQKNQ